MDTFDQILEMDDDEDDEEDLFSRGIVLDFFDQAEKTFDQMDTAMYACWTIDSMIPY